MRGKIEARSPTTAVINADRAPLIRTSSSVCGDLSMKRFPVRHLHEA